MGSVVRLSIRFLGFLLAGMGLFLVWDGVRLVLLGGSPYYVVFGAAILLAGILLFLLREAGGWIYLLAWAGTFFWTIWECGMDWWGWLPRLLGPTLIFFWVVAVFPALKRYQSER
ncbi:glucose dehydrogenase [Acetobacteraceae bacterium]|nr:glucose dehydrogenase [Acetobacteraceae bacterium]